MQTLRGAIVSSNVAIPEGHVGPLTLPGSGRVVWWTGRVAIGLRHQPSRPAGAVSHSAQWVQQLLLGAASRSPRAG
jgi:hypothetical protein